MFEAQMKGIMLQRRKEARRGTRSAKQKASFDPFDLELK
jgi:hypothetical protein